MASKNFITFKDFNIKNLSLCEGEMNKRYNFQTMDIKYAYPDGKTRGLRLRSPVLFSPGIFQYGDKTGEYFLPLRSFYDAEIPTEKEIEFKKTLDNISEFLRKEAKEKAVVKKKKNDFLDALEIVDDNIFFPKLCHNKTFNKDGQVTKCEISTFFYEKNEEGNLEKIEDLESLKKVNCKLVAFIEIEDIFTTPSKVKIWMRITDAVIIKKDVAPPRNLVKSLEPSTEVTLGSDDEDEIDEANEK